MKKEDTEKMERISVNENYEIEYNYSKEDSSYEDFNRNHRIALLSKKREKHKDRKIIRADNCDKQKGKWPTHIHHNENKTRHYLVYCGSGSFESNWKILKKISLMRRLS